MKNNLPARYRELREEKNLTIKELSQKINCNEKTISFYENGDRELSIGTLQKYADFFNVSTDYLLGITDIRSSDIDRKKICEMTGLSGEALNWLIYAREESVNGRTMYRLAILALCHLLTNVQGYEILSDIYDYIHSYEVINSEGRGSHHSLIAGYAGIADKAYNAITKKNGRIKESYHRSVMLSLIGEELEEIRLKYEREHMNFDSIKDEIEIIEKNIKEDQARLKELKKLSQLIDKKNDNSDN